MSNRSLDRVLHGDYVADLPRLPVDDLRAKRSECQRLEDAASYLRRLVQGRLDVIGLEIRSRTSGERADLTAIVEQLPSILAEGTGRTATGRPLVGADTPPDDQEEWASERVQAACGAFDVASAPELADGELFQLTDGLNALERQVSGERRKLHDVIDILQAELVRRYKSGEASVDGLLR